MGYRDGYVANVLNGHTPVSRPFRTAFGEAVAELMLGQPEPPADRYPAAPLVELIRKRAAAASCKVTLYEELGVSPSSLRNRDKLPGALVDQVCCALGVHPSAIYGPNGDVEEAS